MQFDCISARYILVVSKLQIATYSISTGEYRESTHNLYTHVVDIEDTIWEVVTAMTFI